MKAVRADAADDRGRVDDQVRPLRAQPRPQRRGVAQVELALARGKERGRSLPLDPLAQKPAQTPSPPGEEDAAVPPEGHLRSFGLASFAASPSAAGPLRPS